MSKNRGTGRRPDGPEDANPMNRRLPAEIVSRRQHAVKPKAASEKEDVPSTSLVTDLKQVLGMKVDSRAKWLAKALQQAHPQDGRLSPKTIYDIIAHSRFASDVGMKAGKRMYRLLHANFGLFSSKQQKFLEKECTLAKQFAADAFADTPVEEAAGNTTEDMMARCRAFMREKQSERGERKDEQGDEACEEETGEDPQGSINSLEVGDSAATTETPVVEPPRPQAEAQVRRMSPDEFEKWLEAGDDVRSGRSSSSSSGSGSKRKRNKDDVKDDVVAKPAEERKAGKESKKGHRGDGDNEKTAKQKDKAKEKEQNKAKEKEKTKEDNDKTAKEKDKAKDKEQSKAKEKEKTKDKDRAKDAEKTKTKDKEKHEEGDKDGDKDRSGKTKTNKEKTKDKAESKSKEKSKADNEDKGKDKHTSNDHEQESNKRKHKDRDRSQSREQVASKDKESQKQSDKTHRRRSASSSRSRDRRKRNKSSSSSRGKRKRRKKKSSSSSSS
eukprot:TRINITY_DN81777_c0_g1_i2.p1 TRINITY_DN81777_c0_g1~~TRINITY_DN81777_c0_g1_i2.p1  ORF type:complete len:497 (-),score=138.03 TRINITY_DN81777_c0_g1_i2:51-1541(-)